MRSLRPRASKNKFHLFSKVKFIVTAVALAVSGLLPLAVSQEASAAGQLSSRSLQITSGVPSKTNVQYKFTFTVVATSTVQSLKIQFCTTAVGTCSGTAGTDIPNVSSAAWVSQNSWQGAVNFAAGSGSNDCTASSSIICANRTSATNQTATSRDITFGTITNPSTANTTFFARITTYSDNAYTVGNIQDTGTTASAVVQTLTVNAAVAEVLNFCVGSTTVDNPTSTPGASCTNITGTSVNMGVLDSTHVNVTPVSTNCSASDCGKNGVAMVRSNGNNGTVVYYDAIQQSGTNHVGTLRISGATCAADSTNNSTDSTDQCFNERTTQATFTSGTERFGMTVAGVNCGSSSSYASCSGTSSSNLARDTAYDGDGTSSYTSESDQSVTGTTTNGYAWDESGTATTLASSASSTTKVVDDEALILKFAGTPAISTPFGAYVAQADFIAVTTY